ncbi:MAG: NAD(P)/FAD-dependent oxidoreductase [Bacillota bacterium]
MDYLIIGASAAGLSAAKRLRKLNPQAEIKVISKDDRIYSRCMLHHLISGQREVEELKFVGDDFFSKYEIDWLKGVTVTKVNPQQQTVETNIDRELSYDHLLIATGASSFFPPIDNLDCAQEVVGLRNLEDAIAIKELADEIEHAVIIGAGLVGIDAAVGLNELGVEVTIVEMADHILPQQLDQTAAQRYRDRFSAAGIKIMTNSAASEVVVNERDSVQGLKLQDGREVETDLVVVAAGIKPNVDLVTNSELEIEHGIVVNQFQETNLDQIYAAGDVSQSREEFSQELTLTPIWPLAVKQGQTAACNMSGIKRSMNDNFAQQNSMQFMDLATITYGLIEVDSEEYEVKVKKSKDKYQKLILQDNKLQGAILQGTIDNAGVYGKLIQEGIDLTDKQDRLFNLSYADFFQQLEDGNFSYEAVI